MDNKLTQLNFLWDIAKALSDNQMPEKIVNAVQISFEKYLGCKTLEILILNENTKIIKNFAKDWIIIEKQRQNYILNHIIKTFQKIKHSIIFDNIVYDVATREKTKLTLDEKNTSSSKIIYIPLIKKDDIFGIIKITLKEDIVLNEDMLHSFGIIIYQISTAILNNILNNQMQIAVNFHDAMKNIAKIIENQYEFNYIIPLIGEMIDRFVSSHLIYIFLYKKNKGFELLWPGACNEKHIFEMLKNVNKKSEFLISKDKKTGVFPLIQEKKLIGAIVASSNIDILSEYEINYLQQLSNQSSITLQQAGQYCEILKYATLDALTGLNNRRQFDIRLGEAVASAKRQKSSLCCIMIDIDYFKKVNDTYGHIAGDCVLRQVGKIIPQELREYDIAARYGGEEFAIILPFTTVEEAFAVAQRLRKTIEAFDMDISEAKIPDVKTIKVTASMGIGEYGTLVEKPSDLHKLADLALYEAKSHGRNRVIVYHP